MNTASPGLGVARNNLERLQAPWLLLVVVGVGLILLGAVAVSSSFTATFATVLMFGIVLLLGAIFQVFAAVWGFSLGGFFLHLLMAVLYFIVGVFMLERPGVAALALTLLVAACLLVGGILRIVAALVERFDGWEWVLLNGGISVLLGVAIWRQWPISGFWVIGLFVGIEMILGGLSWLMLGLRLRATAKTAPAA